MRTFHHAALALAAAVSLAACAGDGGATGSIDESIKLASLPDNLPGCTDVRARPGVLAARAIAGVHDLYVVFDGGAPLCIDTREDIAETFGAHVEYASSNPMPGTDPAASNPMPGVDPDSFASSNPMPGVDPDNANSNPMPGTNSDGHH